MTWLVLLALLAQPMGSAFDTPIREVTGERRSVLDDLTLSQMMRLSTMAPARLNEARCAGLARWQVTSKRPAALPARQADAMVDHVARALANDVEIGEALGREFVIQFASELDHQRRKRGKADWTAWLAEQERGCADLLDAARAGSLSLHPLSQRSVVDPALATCYARYRVAAAKATGEEAAGLQRDADKAAALALKGKEGADRAAAEAALAAAFAGAERTQKGEDEADMMRLVICQPYLRGTAMQAEAK